MLFSLVIAVNCSMISETMKGQEIFDSSVLTF